MNFIKVLLSKLPYCYNTPLLEYLYKIILYVFLSNILFDLKKKGTLKAGISRRVERPGTWFLSPFPSDFSNPKSFRIGNPLLEPEDILKVELSYSNRMSFGFLSAAIYHDRVKEQFDYDNDDILLYGQNYKVLTFKNIGEAYNNGIEIFLMTKPLKFWDCFGLF